MNNQTEIPGFFARLLIWRTALAIIQHTPKTFTEALNEARKAYLSLKKPAEDAE